MASNWLNTWLTEKNKSQDSWQKTWDNRKGGIDRDIKNFVVNGIGNLFSNKEESNPVNQIKSIGEVKTTAPKIDKINTTNKIVNPSAQIFPSINWNSYNVGKLYPIPTTQKVVDKQPTNKWTTQILAQNERDKAKEVGGYYEEKPTVVQPKITQTPKITAPKYNYTGTAQEIKDIQSRMMKAGYDLGKTGADGKWGKYTQAAYDSFRKDQELENASIGEIKSIPANYWRRNQTPNNNGKVLLDIPTMKKGGSINIKPENKGKFTDYCGGKVTDDCIKKGKNSTDPTVRKRATFASNVRKWKHKEGGILFNINDILENYKK